MAFQTAGRLKRRRRRCYVNLWTLSRIIEGGWSKLCVIEWTGRDRGGTAVSQRIACNLVLAMAM